MKPLFLGMLCALFLAGAAGAEDNGFSFDPASVRFGYADGYWDQDHRWHAWPSARESREFHRRYQERIYGYRHTRYPNDGWRDGAGTKQREKDQRDN